LLRKTVFPNVAWNATASSNWTTCDVMKWLRDTYPSTTNVSSIMNTAKVPYIGTQMNQIISGANGNAAKCFLLSNAEAGFLTDTNATKSLNVCGAKLDYFDETSTTVASSKRIAYSYTNASTAVSWWLRTQPLSNQSNAEFCGLYGGHGHGSVTYTSAMGQVFGVRPCFIVPNDTLIDSNHNIVV